MQDRQGVLAYCRELLFYTEEKDVKSKKIILWILLVLLLVYPALIGAKLLDVELNITDKLLDLDQIIKDEPIGGGDSEAAVDIEEETTKDPSKNVGDDDPTSSSDLVIRVYNKGIYINNVICSTVELERQVNLKKGKVLQIVLVDDYAEYYTYMSAKKKLEEMQVVYIEKRS